MPHWTTQEIFAEIVRRCDAGERVALCTVVTTRGSCPQGAGAKMLLIEAGRTLGTLGGGCVEAEVRTRAQQLLIDNRSDLLQYKLDHDYGWDDGLICGGSMEVLVQPLDASKLDFVRSTLASIARNDRTELRIPFTHAGAQREYVETIDPPPTLLIIGAGHVAQSLASIAPALGFDVDVIDDRPDYASAERFPLARQRIVGDIEGELSRYSIDRHTSVVIVTRGHQRDGQALAKVIGSEAKYIGMIGSKRKVKAIFDGLLESGVSADQLKRIHAPIGLSIGAVSVPEIATSIAAELIAVRRGVPRGEVKPMKWQRSEVRGQRSDRHEE